VTHLALLRGINVGGKNILPMKDLADLFADAGCSQVKTYIQSGNVLLTATEEVAAELPAVIQNKIAEQFGLRVPVITRSRADMERVVAGNPMLKDGPLEELHAIFLADQPTEAQIKSLDPNRSPPDAYIVSGREIYLRFPNGTARSKFTNAYFDSKLKTVSTVRNWRTVTTLVEMMRV